MKKILIVISILSIAGIFHQSSYAQSARVDSLLSVLKTAKDDTNKVNTLNSLSEFAGWRVSDYENAMYYAQNAKLLAEKLRFKKGIASAYGNIGIINYYEGNYPEALKNRFASLKISEEIGDKKGMAGSYTNIAIIYDDQGNYTEALKNYFSALQIQQEIGDKYGKAVSYNNIGSVYNDHSNFTEALKNYFQSLKIREEIGDKYGIVASYNNIGNANYSQGNYPEALKSYFASLKMAEEIADKSGIAFSYNNIGMVHYQQNNYPEALKNYFLSLKLREEVGDKYGIAASYNNIGNVYYSQGNLPEALENYYSSLKIQQEIGDKHGIATSYNNIGLFFDSQGNYPEALNNYFSSLKMNEEIGDKHGMAICYSNIGVVYLKQGKDKEGKEWMKKALELGKELGTKQIIQTIYQRLAQADSVAGNFKGTFENYKMYIVYRDSLYNEENIKKLTQTEMQYEFDKKEAVTAEQLRRQNQQRNAFMGGFGLTLLLAASIFISLQQNKKKNKIITIQKIEVEEKNKHITESIQYAQRIQAAILPPDKLVKEYLKNSFVLYLPKDIVAGDFYWMETVQLTDEKISGLTNVSNQVILFAACDCTGHGVPGAMVSVMCHNALNRAVREYNLIEPAKILDKVVDLVQDNFTKSEDEIQDGMDTSLCAYYPGQHKLQWAGANNPLWIIRNHEILEYKADKQPIGKYEYRKPYTNHEIELQKGDTIYIFSDGYQDQFGDGGEKKLTKKGLRKILMGIQGKTMEEQGKELLKLHNEWKGQVVQIDDICVMGIRV